MVYVFDESQKLVKSKDVKNECQFIRKMEIEEILVKSKDVKNRVSVYYSNDSNNDKKSRQKATSQKFFR